MPTETKKAKSPYQRHQKSPFVYSNEYRAWRAAVREGKPANIRHAAEAHNRRFGLYGHAPAQPPSVEAA